MSAHIIIYDRGNIQHVNKPPVIHGNTISPCIPHKIISVINKQTVIHHIFIYLVQSGEGHVYTNTTRAENNGPRSLSSALFINVLFGSLNRGSVTAWNEWMHLSRAWSCERAARGARRAAGGGGAAAAAVGRQSVAPRAPSPTLRARSECHAAPALIKTFPHWDRSACLYAPRTDNDSSRRRDTVTRVPLDTLLNTCVFVFHM